MTGPLSFQSAFRKFLSAALAALLLAGCSGKKGESPGEASSFPVLRFFPSSTTLFCGLPSPSALEKAAAGKVPRGMTRAVLEEFRPGGFGPFSGEVLQALLGAWKELEKAHTAPGALWFGSSPAGKSPLEGGILLLDFHEKGGRKRRKAFEGTLESWARRGKVLPGGWKIGKEGTGRFLLRKEDREIRLAGAGLGEAYLLWGGGKNTLARIEAARSGKAPSLQGRMWAARVKASLAEGWPSWGAAPGGKAGARWILPALPAEAGLSRPQALFERWSPADGENLLELSFRGDSGFPWKLAGSSVDPEAFASILPADTDAFLLGTWNTKWMKERLFPFLERAAGDAGWLNDLVNQAKRILAVWDEGSILYEMVSEKMLSFGIALRPGGGKGKPDFLVTFGLPRGEESWFLGWIERGYRTQVFPRKKWWKDYLIYERRKDPPMAGTTGKGHLFLASSREALIGWLRAAEGEVPRLAGTGPFKVLSLSLRKPADLFLFVSPKSPAGPWRLLPGAPGDLSFPGSGPFGGGIFLEKGRLLFLSRWPLSPWNLASRRLFLGE